MTLPLKQALLLGDHGLVSITGSGGKTSLMYSLARQLSSSGDRVLSTTTTKIYPPKRHQSEHLVLTPTIGEFTRKAVELLRDTKHLTAAAGMTPQADKLTGFPPWFVDAIAGTGIFRWIIVEADGAAAKPLKAPAGHEPVIPESSSHVVGVLGLIAIGSTLNPENVFRPGRVADISGLSQGDPIDSSTLARVLAHPRGIFQYSPGKAKKIAFLNLAGIPAGLRSAREVVRCLREEAPSISRVVIGNALQEPFILEYHDL
jgi:probable selenium-dependent hydroxylase accessory protein YqeC